MQAPTIQVEKCGYGNAAATGPLVAVGSISPWTCSRRLTDLLLQPLPTNIRAAVPD
jgi:hypothetical protein